MNDVVVDKRQRVIWTISYIWLWCCALCVRLHSMLICTIDSTHSKLHRRFLLSICVRPLNYSSILSSLKCQRMDCSDRFLMDDWNKPFIILLFYSFDFSFFCVFYWKNKKKRIKYKMNTTIKINDAKRFDFNFESEISWFILVENQSRSNTQSNIKIGHLSERCAYVCSVYLRCDLFFFSFDF